MDALEVFADPLRVERVNRRREYAEERREVVGMVRDQMLFVVYTLRGEVRRLISARRASRNERIERIVVPGGLTRRQVVLMF